MKVLHIYWGLGFGGIETMLVNIVNEQVKLGLNVDLLIFNKVYEKSLIDNIDSRVNLFLVDRPLKSKNPFYIGKMNFYITTSKPDIIHFHNDCLINNVLPFLRENCCVTVHNTPNVLNSSFLYKFKRVFAISNSVRDALYSDMKVDALTVANGIFTDKFRKRSDNLQSKILNILQISRLNIRQKAQDLLIRAVHKVVSEMHASVHLDLIGEGESELFLRKLVKELKMDEYVSFLGKKSQDYIFEHLADYDLFVQPSYFEGFGLTVAEAMAAKVPVLVSENDGPLEIVDGGKFGFTFKNRDIDDCAQKILEISRIRDLGLIADAALHRVEEYYSVTNTAREYVDEYETLLLLKDIQI